MREPTDLEDAGAMTAGTPVPPAPVPRFTSRSILDLELEHDDGALEVARTLDWLRDLVYSSAVAAGWHEPKDIEGVFREPSAGERVALMHEELTELLGHVRDGLTDGHWTEHDRANPDAPGKPEGPDVELADVVIRALDYAGRYGIPLGAIIIEKLRYNRTRAHRHGGRTL